MLRFSILIATVVFVLSCHIVLANTDNSPNLQLKNSPIVNKIVLEGLWRTKPYVVLRELLFTENEPVTPEQLYESVQRLKNLRIFSQVIPLLELHEQNRVDIILKLQEKWTIIPFFNVASGGGTTYFNTGAYDINFFGRYLELGGQYENWNGKHGGVVWTRNPRLFDQRLLLGIDIWSTNRPRRLLTRDGDEQGHYVSDRKKFNIFLKKELHRLFQLGVQLELKSDEIIDRESNSLIDQETLSLMNETGKFDLNILSLNADIGKLDYDNYLIEGKLSQLSLSYGGSKTSSDKYFHGFQWENLIFKRLPYFANLGIQINLGVRETNSLQHYHYVGGFENARGYLDGQFRTKAYWQFNAEYRIPSYRSQWLVLQHIFFLDVIGTGKDLNTLAENGMSYYSGGIGVRIISPRIYRFNGRLDIAIITSGEGGGFLSFGSQQFF